MLKMSATPLLPVSYAYVVSAISIGHLSTFTILKHIQSNWSVEFILQFCSCLWFYCL